MLFRPHTPEAFGCQRAELQSTEEFPQLATILKMEAEWGRNLHQNSATGMTVQASAISASMNPES
jgi:hypothetical protein